LNEDKLLDASQSVMLQADLNGLFNLFRMKNTEEPVVAVPANAEGIPSPEPLVTLEPATVSPEQLEELKQKAAKADEHWDRLLRTTADFENFKKRAARERQESIKYANESLLTKLLAVLDSMDMALAAAQAAPADAVQSLQTGLNLVQHQFKTVLTEAGMEEVDASGKVFDPNLHEAISQREAADVPEGTVVHQVRKGYKLRDRLIRPASVIVSKLPAA
jgi:molecular chaperone GrpE